MGWTRAQPQPIGLTPLLDRRFSSRVFDPDHVLAPADLRTLLTAAQWAPSAGNSQPWAFLVGLRGDSTHTRFVRLLSRGNTSWAPRASALLIGLYQSAADPSPDGLAMPYSDYAAHDLGQAAAHLTVQAMSMGLHVHQFAGFDHQAAATEFEVPAHFTVATGIAIGQILPVETIDADDPSLADRERRLRGRKPLAEFVFGGTFGSPAGCTRDPG